MATRPKAVIESRNGEKFSPITIAKNVLTDNGQNLHDILSNRKEDMMTPIIENSSSMFKVGQGDNVDYSENVVDGAYESCVLKGKSLVNILKAPVQTLSGGDPGWKRLNPRWSLKANTKYFALYFVDSNTLNGTIKDVFKYGDDQTIWGIDVVPIGGVGIFKRTFTLSSEITEYNCYTDTSTTGSANVKCVLLEYQEGMEDLDIPYFEGICDCKSPILSNVGKNLFDGLSYIDGFIASGNNYTVSPDTDVTSILVNVNKNTDYILSAKTNFNRSLVGGSLEPISIGTKTTNLNAERISNTIKFNSGEYTNIIIYLNSSKIDIEDIQVEEGSVSTTYEPYKSNILSCNGDKIELTEDMFEQGSLFYDRNTFEEAKMHANNDTGTRSIRIRTKKLIKVKPNTTYRFSYTNSCQSWFYGYDMNENPTNNKSTVVGATEQVFTTSANTHFLAFVLFKTGNPSVTPSDYDYKSIQIREVDKTIVLRSLPNGVCDTLNVETGEYVQRISEVILNGSENWMSEPNFIHSTLIEFKMNLGFNIKSNNSIICGGFLPTGRDDVERIYVMKNGVAYVRILKSKVATVDEFKQLLQSKPVTIQYELETPIVKTVDLSGFPFSYENGHIILSSGSIEQSLTPTVEYSVATNRNGQIRSNQKMVERHQKQLDRLQAMILTNLVNTQYEQTLTNLKYDLKNVREEVK